MALSSLPPAGGAKNAPPIIAAAVHFSETAVADLSGLLGIKPTMS